MTHRTKPLSPTGGRVSEDAHLHLSTMTRTGRHGRIAENLVVWFLKNRGYHVVDRNFRTTTGEIDIIALERRSNFLAIHFVEVKSRYGHSRAMPEYAVTYTKQKKIFGTARFWILTHRYRRTVYHFDIAAVLIPDRRLPHIRYLPDAYYPRQEFGW